MTIKSVVIIGGGASGWWTAGYLEKNVPGLDITLIESQEVPRIGVGESTVPAIKTFFDSMGIEEKDWLDKSYGIRKLGNFKQGWNSPNDDGLAFTFWYNYGNQFDSWVKDYFAGKKTKQQINDDLYRPNSWASYSYHIDAESSAYVVKNMCKNVKHIVTTIDNKLQLPPADLYVDCTGLGRKFVKDHEELELQHHLVDSCIVCPFERDDEPKLYTHTKSIARPYGWEFQIDLQHRMGVGYCYSSKFVSDRDALEHYTDLHQHRKTWNNSKPRVIKWKPSVLKNPWTHNTVAIGLSAGFVDPLEANALFLTQMQITALARSINRGLTAEAYNRLCRQVQKQNSDYILHHYALARRNDTEFWRYYKNIDVKKSLWENYKNKNSTKLDSYPDSIYATLGLYFDEFTYYKPKEISNE